MPHTVQLPDGRSVDFPETMSDSEINSAVQGLVGSPQSSATPVMDAIRQDDQNRQPGALSQTGQKIKNAWDWMWHSNATENIPGMKSESQKLTDIQDSPQQAQPSSDPYALNPRFLSPETQDIIRRTLAGTERDFAALSPGELGMMATGGAAAGGLKPAQAIMKMLLPVFAAQTAIQTGQGAKKLSQGNVMGTSQETGGLSDLANAGSNLALMGAGGGQEGLDTTREFFKSGLASSAHDILNKNSTLGKKQLWDAHAKVGERVGQLVNDITAADYQAQQKGDPGINISDIWGKIQKIADDYKAGGKDTPKFNVIQDAILKQNPNVSWKQLHDMQMELGSSWAKSPEGTRDSGALNALRDAISQKLSQRASDLGRGKQYEAYNTLWRTLKGYEGDGAMGKLLNAPAGKDFFDIMRDPKFSADLTRTVDSLSKFGLPEKYLQTLTKTNQPLHDYVKIAGGTQLGFGGKMRAAGEAIKQHPLTGLPAVAAGATVGSALSPPGTQMIGGGMGAIGTLRAMNRWGAAGEVARQGRPSLKGEMTDAAQVQPVGGGQKPPNVSIDPKLVNEVTSALVNQGVPKSEASVRARAAVEKHGNFNDAFNLAIRRPQEVKAQAIQKVKQPQSSSPATVSVTPLSERPGKKILAAKSGEERIGQVSLTPINEVQQGAYEISTSQIKPSFRGEGKGKEMYRQVIDYAKKTGATAIYSDDQMSPEAKGVWESLSKEFPVKKEGGRYKIDLAKSGIYSGSSPEGPAVKALTVQKAQNAAKRKK